MHEAAKEKLGFYPIPTDVMVRIIGHLAPGPLRRTENQNSIAILDPCAGRGDALAQLLGGLSLPESAGYAIELDEDRGDALRDRYPGIHCLSPASYFGCGISGRSFGAIYLNPPFDDELRDEGRRQEESFLTSATFDLAPNGVLIFVCPDHILCRPDIIDLLDGYFCEVQVYRFPDSMRKYNEVIVFGIRRGDSIPKDDLPNQMFHRMGYGYNRYQSAYHPEIGTPYPDHYRELSFYPWEVESYRESITVYPIPRGFPPSKFRKIKSTAGEMARFVEESPLSRIFLGSIPAELPRPPLPPDRGHLGMILASGMIDGAISDANQPHVVRGTNHKQEYYNVEESMSSEDPSTGAVTTKEVFSEVITTLIRAVDEEGKFYEFADSTETMVDPSES